jgi:predicted adenylyl cyclase CyaB
MIEVERKIEVGPEFLNYLARHGSFVSKKTIEDTYFDTSDYRYTTQNIWLRERERRTFELKKAIKRADLTIDRYEEITNLEAILEVLGINDMGDFTSSLSQAGIGPFATFVTHREKYQLQEFTIDVDVADFGDFTYQIAEIECLVENEDEIPKAELQINELLKKLQIDTSKKPCAKLTAYLIQCRPKHYKALHLAGVV